MMTLIAAAALAAGQPAPMPMPPQGHAMPMNHQQHDMMKGGCCCCCHGMEEHDMHGMHAPEGQPQDERGE